MLNALRDEHAYPHLDTFLSNHTVYYLGDELNYLGGDVLSTCLYSLLELNRCADKKQVATQKIPRHHDHFDMEPFLEWDLGVLPHVVGWFGRANEHAQRIVNSIITLCSIIRVRITNT